MWFSMNKISWKSMLSYSFCKCRISKKSGNFLNLWITEFMGIGPKSSVKIIHFNGSVLSTNIATISAHPNIMHLSALVEEQQRKRLKRLASNYIRLFIRNIQIIFPAVHILQHDWQYTFFTTWYNIPLPLQNLKLSYLFKVNISDRQRKHFSP